jgi:hypothetical protein
MAELHSIRERLETLAEDVLAGRVDRGDAAVVGQLYNTLIRAVSTEMKVREVTELRRGWRNWRPSRSKTSREGGDGVKGQTAPTRAQE